MQVAEITLVPTEKGASTVVTVVAASVNRYQVLQDAYIVIAATAQMTMCRGDATTSPTANDSQLIVANNQYRTGPWKAGQYMCFFSTPGGDVYITPQA